MSSGNEGVKIKSTWWSSNLNLGHAHLLTYGPLLRLCKSNVKHAYSMYITSTCIHLDPWKSLMKFGIKKSHEMISHIFAWIALSSGSKPMKSTKPWYLAQTTLLALMNKSYEGFMLSRWPENAPIDQKGWFKLYSDATLTWFELQLRVFAWQWNLNKSWSPSYVEQTLFNDQELDQLGNKSNRGHKIEFAVVFNT